LSINEIAMKQILIFFVSAFMCLSTYGQNTYNGKIIYLPNPPQTVPPLPGGVFGLSTTSDNYILTISSSWIWSNNALIVEDVEYFIDDEVEITGTITTKQDINSNEYTELEITSIKKSPLSNIETLSFDNKKVYYDATKQVIVIDETLLTQSLTFELVDIQGKVILRKTGISDSSISIVNLLYGVYLYRLTQNKKIIHIGKILKND